MAEMPDVIAGEVIEVDWGNDIRDRTVQRYASVAARTASIPSPTEGDLSYLEDGNTVWVYNGSSWVQLLQVATLLGSDVEVDGADAVSSIAVPASFGNVATVNLSIPAGWGSWRCFATASAVVLLDDAGSAPNARLRVDGTDLQSMDNMGQGTTTAWRMPFGIVGRRTGMTTTGSRAVSLQMSGDGTALDITLYARAVRTG